MSKMGEFDLFLVPISGDRNGFRYEAVFNYYRKTVMNRLSSGRASSSECQLEACGKWAGSN